MRQFIPYLIIIFLMVGIFHCTDKKENTIDLNMMPFLYDTRKVVFLNNEIDQGLTPNCGTAAPVTSTTGTGTTTTTATSGGKTPAVTRFTIISQLVMKLSKEVLNMKFIYDTTQTQGNIDPQQGFTFTGGVFSDTVTGKQGTVKWNLNGIGVDETNSGTQVLQYMKVELNLSGTYTAGVGTTVTPSECPTVDNINCTSTNTTTKCFTVDNSKCLNSQSTTGGEAIYIRGTINCYAKNIPL